MKTLLSCCQSFYFLGKWKHKNRIQGEKSCLNPMGDLIFPGKTDVLSSSAGIVDAGWWAASMQLAQMALRAWRKRQALPALPHLTPASHQCSLHQTSTVKYSQTKCSHQEIRLEEDAWVCAVYLCTAFYRFALKLWHKLCKSLQPWLIILHFKYLLLPLALYYFCVSICILHF